jgi:integrase/recombinase XerD
MSAPNMRKPIGKPRRLKHLPEDQWPAEDHRLFAAAYAAGDIFDDHRGAGAHLAAGTRRSIRFAWRRWLGFLAEPEPQAIRLPAAERITPERVRAYVEHLSGSMAPGSVAVTVALLFAGARLIAPDWDWRWLTALKTRLAARATCKDRFDRLVPAHRTLQLGIGLMEQAGGLPAGGREARELQYRDGLVIALLSLWPIRRRSLAALTLGRHVRLEDDRIELCLYPQDTKSKRAESWPVPELLLPFFRRYLDDVRPRLLGRRNHDALWVGQHGTALQPDALYGLVRRRTAEAFGTPMALHDFRRAAATFLAMDAPEKVGLTPGILQHTSPEVGNRFYNLSRSVTATRRHAATVAALKDRLRLQSR